LELRSPRGSKGLSEGCTGLGLGLLTQLPLHCAMQKIRDGVMPGDPLHKLTPRLRQTSRLGHVEIAERPQRGAKNLPNLVKITSRDWLAWVKRGAQWDRVQKFKNVSTSKSWENKEAGTEIAEGQQGAIRGMHWARTGPPNPAPSSLRDAEDKRWRHAR
jgi:hypothetical protein